MEISDTGLNGFGYLMNIFNIKGKYKISGIFLGLIAFSMYFIADTCVKSLNGRIPSYEIVFFGSIIGCFALPFVKEKDEKWIDLMRPRLPILWFARGTAYIIESIFAVIAFTQLSLAMTYSLLFLTPIIATALASYFIKEHLTLKSWSGIFLGFVGVLIILRPHSGIRIGIGEVSALICAFAGAVDLLILRLAGDRERNISQIGAQLVIPMIVTAAMCISRFTPLSLLDIVLVSGFGVGAVTAGLVMIKAMQLAPVGKVAPTQYVQMLWAVLFGYLFFNDILDGFVLIGITFIMFAGYQVFPKTSYIE